MRGISERFTDGEFKELKEAKGDRTWREAILEEFGVNGHREEGDA